MNDKHKNTISKFLSLILRHSPGTIGLTLDENGWADVEDLLLRSAQNNNPFSREELTEVVTTNDKQRFVFNEDATKIRANQGHSVEVDLNLASQAPPKILYHGTVARFLEDIKAEGLKKMSRLHVHLSKDIATAEKVGNRRGEAIILGILSGVMYENGFVFYLAANGVWLTDNVPAQYIDFKIVK
jgi:putative RNA 2'-phosphotransferase